MPMRLGRCLAAAILICANRVHAFPVSEYLATRNDTLELHISGSSAQDDVLERLMRRICLPASLDIYRAGDSQRAMLCRLTDKAGGIATISAGQKVAVLKSSVGRSGFGVGPLIARRPLEFISLDDFKENGPKRCPTDRARKVSGDDSVPGYTEHRCTNPRPAFRVPDIGISDTDPTVFAGDFSLGREDLATLAIRSANALVFGVPVSLKLRNALQAAQFGGDSPCHPAHAGYGAAVPNATGEMVPRGETEACMPSLHRSQIAGIYAGTMTDWRNVLNPTGYPLATTAGDGGAIVVAPGVEAPTDTRTFLCRRVDSSGTQASYAMYFLNARCVDGVRGFAKAGPTVQIVSGNGDIKRCLDEHDARGRWAIGLFGTDNVAGDGDAWRFIKVDNVAPTLFNAMTGRWDFFAEQTFLWRGDKSDEPLSGMSLLLTEYFAAEAGNPVILRDLNRSFRHPWGDGGVMALNTNGFVPPLPTPGAAFGAPQVREYPVLASTHAATGVTNSCGPPLSNFPMVTP